MSAICSDSGVDTVRFRWRTSNDVYRDFQRRPEGTIEGHRGERYTQTDFGRLGVYPDGLVYLEGRASAIEFQNKDDHGLATVERLHSAERVARSLVTSLGADVGDEVARLGRVDLAAELRFSDPDEGSAFLHSLASLDVPWCKSRTDGRKGNNIETVSFHGTQGRTIYLRAYDKGVESKTAPAGYRIRVERQKRFRKEKEPNVTMFKQHDLRSIYLGREFAKLTELPNATVCDVPEALTLLGERVRTYGLSSRMHELLAGYIVVGWDVDYNRSTFYNRASALRDLGIFVDPTQMERLDVPVGRYLQTLASSWAA